MSSGGNQRFAHPAVPILLGLLVMVGGGYLYYSGMQATANAEEVDATVVSSTFVDNSNTGGNDADEYTVAVEYRYTYDGQTHTSENLCPGAGSGCKPSSDFRSDMEDFLADYPEGETVTAYVSSSNPSSAYLIDTGPSLIYLVVVGFGLFILLLGARRLVTGE